MHYPGSQLSGNTPCCYALDPAVNLARTPFSLILIYSHCFILKYIMSIIEAIFFFKIKINKILFKINNVSTKIK